MASTTFEEVPAPAEANGHAETDLANGTGEENGAAVVPRGLYLARIPKPPMDDTELKKLQAEFQRHIAALKAKNSELAAKREVVRNFKRQMGEARGLKETSEPEYQDKRSRIMELRKVRGNYLDRIKAIKENLQGLDCKSEAELDEKVRGLEHRIAHEGMPLREEKQVVQQIAKLNAMRGRIRDYDIHKNELVELESEAAKIKTIINDMDSEFSVIQTERDATKAVVKDISGYLKNAQDEVQELEREHTALLELKDATLKNLDSQREQTNASMRDYRENRKFSLVVRDMVAAGQTEEAAALVRTQVDEWVAKLSSDTEYRNDYLSLWASQRKFPVSELLPKSCTAAPDSSARPGAGRGDGRGGRGAGGRAPPPEARGAEKAKSIIEQLLQQASQEAQKARALTSANGGSDGDDEQDAGPVASAPVKKAEPYQPPNATSTAPKVAPRLVADSQAAAAAAAAAFNFKVELPKVPEQPEFVLPVIAREETANKEQLREEQLRKAAEAEERKRKRAETAERKKQQAAEAAKKLEQERRDRDVAARTAAISSKKASTAVAEAVVETQAADEPVQSESIAAPTVQQQTVSKMSAPTAFEKRQMLAAAKRPKSRNTPVKQVQSFWNQNQGWIIFAVVLLLCIILGIMFLI